MRTYKYVDHKESIIINGGLIRGRIVFECIATSQEEADNRFRQETGADPNKLSSITCRIEIHTNKRGNEEYRGQTSDNPIVLHCPSCNIIPNPSGVISNSFKCEPCNKWIINHCVKNMWYKMETFDRVFIRRFVDPIKSWDMKTQVVVDKKNVGRKPHRDNMGWPDGDRVDSRTFK